jgi:predicted HicB family RNase H-like nuclease
MRLEPQSFRSSGTLEQPKKNRKVGRPKMARGEAKGRIVPVRFRPDDLKRMEAAARASKQSLSEWIRGTIHAAIQ